MVNPWRKYKAASKRKKTALHSLLAGLGFFSVIYIVTKIFSITLCPIQNIFGKDCFGCGLSRGFVAILSFDLKTATEHHVLSIPLFVSILIYSVICILDIMLDKNNLEKIEAFLTKKYMLAVYLIILFLSACLNQPI